MTTTKTLNHSPAEKFIDFDSIVATLELPIFAIVAALLPPRAWGPFIYFPAAVISTVRTIRDTLSASRFAAYNKRYRLLTGKLPTAMDSFRLTMDRRAAEGWTHLLTLRCLFYENRLPNIRIVGEEHLKAALAEGKGAIIWDSTFTQNTLTTKMGLYQAGYPMLHLSRPDHGLKSRFARRFLNPIKIAGECKYIGERVVIEDNQTGPAMRRLAAGLAENKVISITVINLARKVVRVKCLEGEISLATGPAKLARRQGARLLPVFTTRTGLNNVQITIDPPLPLDSSSPEEDCIKAACKVYGDSLGRHLRKYAGQWQGWTTVSNPGAAR